MEEIRFETLALKKGQEEIKIKLDTLLTHNDNSVINQFSHLLPICSMESFDEINECLINSEENFISLVRIKKIKNIFFINFSFNNVFGK